MFATDGRRSRTEGAGTLLSVLTPPAIVRHLLVSTFLI